MLGIYAKVVKLPLSKAILNTHYPVLQLLRERSCREESIEMDWLYPRRGPEWKQGWTGRTLTSFSLPPAPLLAMFAIVIFLLSISQATNYKEQLDRASIIFQLLLFLAPIILIFLMHSSFTSWRFNFWVSQPGCHRDSFHLTGGFPWGVAILVVALLVLVSYQSSFQSKWFFPFRRSD